MLKVLIQLIPHGSKYAEPTTLQTISIWNCNEGTEDVGVYRAGWGDFTGGKINESLSTEKFHHTKGNGATELTIKALEQLMYEHPRYK